jgi:hypothetical protein
VNQCPSCQAKYVVNTLFCAECGSYLPQGKPRSTDPLDPEVSRRTGESLDPDVGHADSPKLKPLALRLRIGTLAASLALRPVASDTALLSARPSTPRSAGHTKPHLGPNGKTSRARQLEISLSKPVRLGRVDPTQGIFPEVDLTEDHALEYGVSREHACIFQREDAAEVTDLGSTNGTLLNGQRLAPYSPQPLSDGDHLQLGRLVIEVRLSA